MHWSRFESQLVFIKSLTIIKLWNSFLLRLSYSISRIFSVYVHWGYPESLSIEPTNLCNLKCPECPSGNNKMTRARLFLSFSDFTKIIDQTGKYLVNLQLFFQGEPFMHPKLFDFIEYATAKNIYTSISTNGHYLSDKNCIKLLNAGLKHLIISIDGTTQETYQAYRVGGNLNTVLQGVENIVKHRYKRKQAYPKVIIQFVVFSTNEDQIPAIKQIAKRLKVDSLQLKTAQIDDFENGNELIPRNNKLSRYRNVEENKFELLRKANFKCKRIWNGSVISADARLLPCCFDKNAEYAYGKVNSNKIISLWKSNDASSFRKQVWHNHDQFAMCRNCTEGIKKHRGMLGV